MAAPGMTPGQMLDMMNRMNVQSQAQQEPRRVIQSTSADAVREIIKEVPVEVIKYVDREVCADSERAIPRAHRLHEVTRPFLTCSASRLNRW